MSELVHPDDALVPILKRIATGDLRYRLYAQNTTPSKASVLSDFNSGLMSDPVDVPASDFSLDGVAGHKGTIIAAPVALVNGNGVPMTAYGYFITDTSGADLIGALRFSASVTLAAGDSHNVTPILGDSSFYPV